MKKLVMSLIAIVAVAGISWASAAWASSARDPRGPAACSSPSDPNGTLISVDQYGNVIPDTPGMETLFCVNGAWIPVSRPAKTATVVVTCQQIGQHECITASRDRASITVPDNGVQPLCPFAERGWTETAQLSGTPLSFGVRCDAAGQVSVWDAIS